MAGWFGLVFYSGSLIEVFGRISWAEMNMWGTRNAYILAWFGLMVLGFLILFGVVDINKSADPLVIQ